MSSLPKLLLILLLARRLDVRGCVVFVVVVAAVAAVAAVIVIDVVAVAVVVLVIIRLRIGDDDVGANADAFTTHKHKSNRGALLHSCRIDGRKNGFIFNQMDVGKKGYEIKTTSLKGSSSIYLPAAGTWYRYIYVLPTTFCSGDTSRSPFE